LILYWVRINRQSAKGRNETSFAPRSFNKYERWIERKKKENSKNERKRNYQTSGEITIANLYNSCEGRV